MSQGDDNEIELMQQTGGKRKLSIAKFRAIMGERSPISYLITIAKGDFLSGGKTAVLMIVMPQNDGAIMKCTNSGRGDSRQATAFSSCTLNILCNRSDVPSKLCCRNYLHR